MSRAPSRFITLDPESQRLLLKRLAAPKTCALERRRITVLLMSHAGSSIPQLEKSKLLTRKSITRLFDRWETLGVDAVNERPHPGAVSSVTPQMRAWILEQVHDDTHTWNASTVSEALEREFGVSVAPNTLLAHFKTLGLSWQRTRYVVSGTPDPHDLERVQSGLPTLKRGR